MKQLDINTLAVTASSSPESSIRRELEKPFEGKNGNLVFVGEGNLSVHPELINSTNLAMMAGCSFKDSLLLGLIGKYRTLLEKWVNNNVNNQESSALHSLIEKAWVLFIDGISISSRSNIHHDLASSYYHQAINGEYAVSYGIYTTPDSFSSTAGRYYNHKTLDLSIDEFEAIGKLTAVLLNICTESDLLVVEGAYESANSTDALFDKLNAPAKNARISLRNFIPVVFPNTSLFDEYASISVDIGKINALVTNWYSDQSEEATNKLSGLLALHMGLIGTSALEMITLVNFYRDLLPSKSNLPNLQETYTIGDFTVKVGIENNEPVVDVLYEDNRWTLSTMQDLIVDTLYELPELNIRIPEETISESKFNPFYIALINRVADIIKKALATGEIEAPNLMFEFNQQQDLVILLWAQLVYGRLIEQVFKGKGKKYFTKENYLAISKYAEQVAAKLLPQLSSNVSPREANRLIIESVKNVTLETILATQEG